MTTVGPIIVRIIRLHYNQEGNFEHSSTAPIFSSPVYIATKFPLFHLALFAKCKIVSRFVLVEELTLWLKI